MHKPRKYREAFRTVKVPNPDYLKQLVPYKEFLLREAKRLGSKLGNVRSEITKIDKQLKGGK